ncbi:oxidoreductase [Oceanobacillus piezotolerans]|uniref:Oxidoreductase n=1 Tax=Oceanobacillus piezotolerans TaxID=2448030 RepID=A0A498DCV7_9BACI|nr:NAD(P)/FAD-dependent oxidoreductase [Oceanobacillus piezotolerans]RLL46807.1 oxidoreductase [Oceanobacillus piezotolerans]
MDVVIIGGGQAGLAMGYALKRYNVSFIILDENSETGASWKKRYDSLKLFTPRMYSQLHSMTFEGDPMGFPHKDEVVTYLQKFKSTNDLPVVYNQKVIKLLKEDKQTFRVFTQDQSYTACHVVVATGAFYDPFIPPIHDGSVPFMIHASDYQNSIQIPQGEVLVIGAGNTGIQIAAELSRTHYVTLSKSKGIKRLPQKIAGKSLFWWYETLGVSKAKPDSLIGRYIQKREPIIGDDFLTVKKHVEVVSRVKAVKKGIASFQNSPSRKVKSIIWATGYRNHYSWIDIKGVLNEEGKPIHQFGVSNVEGLYFLGLSWQSKRSSALIYGVSDDANAIAERIMQR